MCFINCVIALLFVISCMMAKDPSVMPYAIIFSVLAIIGEIADGISRLLISKAKNLDKITEKLDIEWICLDNPEDKDD